MSYLLDTFNIHTLSNHIIKQYYETLECEIMKVALYVDEDLYHLVKNSNVVSINFGMLSWQTSLPIKVRSYLKYIKSMVNLLWKLIINC